MNRLVNYLKASQLELKKVVWPSKKEVITHTMLVIGISVGVALFLGVTDYVLTLLLDILL
ncbi:MAG: preprotein translocase subunit SecE [Candidatus Buchananbacteria bacterium]|nr:preprotein translocase subunit SecE [Candidatus Buchananbacteria bacterium]